MADHRSFGLSDLEHLLGRRSHSLEFFFWFWDALLRDGGELMRKSTRYRYQLCGLLEADEAEKLGKQSLDRLLLSNMLSG